MAIERWRAVKLEEVKQGGRTKPLIVQCAREEDTHEEKAFLVKAPGLPEVTELGLFCEIAGNLLARELGILTAEPALIECGEEFVRTTNVALRHFGIHIEPGPAVGCRYIHPGLSTIVHDARRSADELLQAASIFGFDLLTQNPDRRPEKPNCGQVGGGLLAFDFEMCFSFMLVIGNQHPAWQLSATGIGPKHLFHEHLRASPPDWTSFVEAACSLTGERIDLALEGLPAKWWPYRDRIKEHWLEATADRGKLALELVRSLQ